MKLREFFVQASLKYDSKAWSNFNQKVSAVGGNLRSIGTAVAGASAALLGVTKVASSNSRELDLNSQSLGINVKRLQELEFAAKDVANVSRGELTGALEGISQSLIEAERSGNVGTFQQIGIDLATLRKSGFRADQVMGIVADRFKLIKDPITKASVATDLFGSAGIKLIPLLNKGSKGIANAGAEARKLGIILSGKSVKAGVQFDRQFNRTVEVMKNLAFTIGTKLFPVVEPVIKKFQEFIIKNKELLATGAVEFAKQLGQFLVLVFKATQGVIAGTAKMVEYFGGFENVVSGLGTALAFIMGGKLVHSIIGVVSAVKVLFGLAAIGNPFAWITIAVTGIARLIQKWDDMVAIFTSSKGVIEGIGGAIGEFFGAGESGQEAGSFLEEKLKAFDNYFQDSGVFKYLAGNATPGGIQDGAATTNNQSSSHVNIPITVNATTNSSAEDIASSISQQVQEFFGKENRNLVNNSVGGAVR